ncbi:MAG TPA: ABC transporter substrate-binding protein [Flavobacterium sp.]|nr:ABC transporter substrate-binding protein [Flavobacterium sp.]
MKNTIKLFAITLFLSFASCKTDKNKDTATAETAETISVTHPLGTAKIVQTPQRVVVLDFAVVETLDELGIKIIGMPKENIPDYLQKYRDDSSITNLGTLKEIDYEKLNELNPDVIFMSGRLQNVYPELNKIAPTVYTEIDYTDYMNSIEENFGIIGEVFGRKDAIDNALNTLKEKIAAVHKQMNDSDQKALVVLHNNGRFSAYGKGSRFGMIHDVLGVKEAVENLEVTRHGQAVSNEFIQEANPDYLYIIDRTAVIDREETNKEAIENRLIQQTNAYKNGKIIYLDAEIWYLSGGGITSINKMIDEIARNL